MELTEAEIAMLPLVVRQQYEADLAASRRAADEQAAKQPETDRPEEIAPENPAPAAPVASDDGLRHRFDVLQGKYNAEVPRLHDELRATRSENERLRAELAAMSRPEQTAPQQPANVVAGGEEYGFGEGEAKWIADVARSALQDDIAALKQSAQAMEEQRAQAAAERFYADLDKAAPGWRETWQDAGFASWLDDNGVRQPLQAVVDANDARGIAFYINTYRSYRQQQKAATPARPAAADRLAGMVEPERGRAAELPAAKPMLRREDLHRLSMDFGGGRITKAEFDKQIVPFEAAEREGRLI